MQAGLKAVHDCVHAFSETDFTEDLKKIDIPVLLLHGDDDQIVPIEDSAKLAVKLLPRGTLRVYEGGSHGLWATHRERFSEDLLSFARG
jgi:non-heme chloroperoxidase